MDVVCCFFTVTGLGDDVMMPIELLNYDQELACP
jgi:hypothetical protein